MKIMDLAPKNLPLSWKDSLVPGYSIVVSSLEEVPQEKVKVGKEDIL